MRASVLFGTAGADKGKPREWSSRGCCFDAEAGAVPSPKPFGRFVPSGGSALILLFGATLFVASLGPARPF